jgi:hypothetical protein
VFAVKGCKALYQDLFRRDFAKDSAIGLGVKEVLGNKAIGSVERREVEGSGK